MRIHWDSVDAHTMDVALCGVTWVVISRNFMYILMYLGCYS